MEFQRPIQANMARKLMLKSSQIFDITAEQKDKLDYFVVVKNFIRVLFKIKEDPYKML